MFPKSPLKGCVSFTRKLQQRKLATLGLGFSSGIIGYSSGLRTCQRSYGQGVRRRKPSVREHSGVEARRGKGANRPLPQHEVSRAYAGLCKSGDEVAARAPELQWPGLRLVATPYALLICSNAQLFHSISSTLVVQTRQRLSVKKR